jgi:hypothetical protein
MPEKKKLYGKFFGIPYDFRKPTWEKIKNRVWNPRDMRVFPPKVWGAGWTVNWKNPKSILAMLLIIAIIVVCVMIAFAIQ